ncbi:MAG TPA: RNA 2',3'-cyclic phosphodiesterase [Candidatus Baltobacteraceae bacterium]|nr:RNA 2',3'-cyclic phosphodiesterase [Candidatus Baltobacteraceae bacterium]
MRRRRLFAGVELDDATRSACAAAALSLEHTGFLAKYEAPEKLHVTLAFLGYVEAERVAAVRATLAAIASRFAPFAVSLDKLGAFPHERRPRIVFVGSRAQGAAFRTLAVALRDAYRELGFAFEEDAVAHVTIARVKEPKRPLPHVDLAAIRMPVQSLVLFESLPDPANRTTRYETMARAPLTGR